MYKSSNYVEQLIILTWAITGGISVSAVATLVCVPVGITSSAIR